jgi:polyphosphate kinase
MSKLSFLKIFYAKISFFFIIRMQHLHYSFETRPGRSTRDPTDPGLEPGRVEEKIGKVINQCDPVTQLTRQNPVKNSVAIC